ncbi:BTAD domain-containing putative transcriptional regulator [Kitasatospora sp. NPDC057015]|uniref:AfsR/SARP family transcriptional regulator n=1 Tax=Kitasatospora sp. NPDC057015 TaxID=3346001 RepID=UPI0036265357
MTAHPGTEVRFQLLGALRAWEGRREVALGAPKQRAVLAALLLRPGRVVASEEVIESVWCDPPRAAAGMVRAYVSHIRAALAGAGARGGPAHVLVSVSGGYALWLAEGAVDLEVFEQGVARARALRSQGELRRAADGYQQALGLWQGPPLAGVPGPYAELRRARLTEVRVEVQQESWELDLVLGRRCRVAEELSALAAQRPLRAQWARLLAQALSGGGAPGRPDG